MGLFISLLFRLAASWRDAFARFPRKQLAVCSDAVKDQIVSVAWSGTTLVVIADNDFDTDGEALADEFSDTVAAYVPGTPGYRVRILSAVSVGDTPA